MEKQKMQEIRKEVKEIKKPYVFKHKNGSLFIIYEDRVEMFEFKRTETKKQIDEENPDCSFLYDNIYGKGWNKEHEAQLCRDNGYREVHLKQGGEQ